MEPFKEVKLVDVGGLRGCGGGGRRTEDEGLGLGGERDLYCYSCLQAFDENEQDGLYDEDRFVYVC